MSRGKGHGSGATVATRNDALAAEFPIGTAKQESVKVSAMSLCLLSKS